MANIGRWVGGAQTNGPSTAWAAPINLFTTEQRNDSSLYTFTPTVSQINLPAAAGDLADGYLIIAAFEYVDTSNGRFNPQGKIVQSNGTGTFIGGATGGYNRDNSEDTSWVRAWAFIDNPSAAASFRFNWKRDGDNATGGTSWSAIEIISFYYSDIGLFSSTSNFLYGGTTPNVLEGWSGQAGSNITRFSNTITLSGNNKRYLAMGSQFFEGRGGRTQRWHGFLIDGVKDDSSKAYSYYRNGNNDESGEMFTQLIEVGSTSVEVEQFCYRGDGVGAGQGGADIDGSTPTSGDHAMVIIELNDSAEVFRSFDGTGFPNLNVTGPVDISISRASDTVFSDSGSWVRNGDTSMQAQIAMDALFGANMSAAQNVVSTTSRWTASARFTVNSVEDDDTRAGDYARNNQGSTDTFGWSANLLSFVALSNNDNCGVSIQELAGGEAGGQMGLQAGWGGFWGVNLDTLDASGSIIIAPAESLHGHEVDPSGLVQSITLPAAETAHGHQVDGSGFTQGHNLATGETLHGHQADQSGFAQSVIVSSNETLHGHQVDGSGFTQGHNLAPGETLHGHQVDPSGFSQSVIIPAAQTVHGHQADGSELNQGHSLATGETLHGHQVDGVSLVQAALMVTAETLHGHQVDPSGFSQSVIVSSNEALHGHQVDGSGFTQGHSLAPGETIHGHQVDGSGLTQGHNLAPGETLHGHQVDGLSMVQAALVVTSETEHGHQVGGSGFTQDHNLAPGETIHGHQVDSVGFVSDGLLFLAETLHGHIADPAGLSQSNSISPNETDHGHQVDGSGFTQGHSLAPGETLHGHQVDASGFAQSVIVSSNEALHGHQVDGLSLIQAALVVTTETLHGHQLDGSGLNQGHSMATDETNHGHICDESGLIQSHLIIAADNLHSQSVEASGFILGFDLLTDDSIHTTLCENTSFLIIIDTALLDLYIFTANTSLMFDGLCGELNIESHLATLDLSGNRRDLDVIN